MARQAGAATGTATTDGAAAGCPVGHAAAPVAPPRGSRWPALVQTVQSLLSPGTFTRHQHRDHGDVFEARSLLGRSISVADPALVEEIVSAPKDVLHAGSGNAIFLSALFGDRGILVVDEDEHTRTRKALMPPFRGKQIALYEPIVRAETERRIARWEVGQEITVHDEARAITLEVILRTVFGATEGAEIDELRAAVLEASDITLVKALWTLRPALFGKVWPWRAYARTISHTNDLLDRMIAERRLSTDLAERTDTLSVLVRDSTQDDRWIRDQLWSLLGAGHETTTTALSWAMELLSRHPDVRAKARDSGDEYLDAVINETLRLRPVLGAINRRVARPVTLGGFTFRKGIMINPQVDTVHRDPRLWADPEAFRPERFLEGRPSTSTYFPYGGGQRRCIGALFAHSEMKVALRTILDAMDFTHVGDGAETQKNSFITLAPSRGAAIRRTR